MDKNKKEILILIIIIFVGVNYALYQLFMLPQLNKVEDEKKIYEQNEKKLSDSYQKKSILDKMKKDNEQMKEKIAELDNLTVKDANTPQLVYDFYTACKKYGIKGDSVNFAVDNSIQTNSNNQKSNNSQINSGQSNTSGLAKGNSDNSSQQSSNSNNTASSSLNVKAGVITRIKIALKVKGNKDKVDNFLRNLSTITSLRLTVVSVDIEAIQSQVPVVPFSTTQINNNTIDSNEMSAEIVFYQYILPDVNSKTDNQYNFYDGKNGFNSIANMIK
ncbi:MAG: hypothetical protein ABF633_15380 [Clostridium sp.]|uniref:hypothetical protein n=1 Tax=Clostridium sp. TaxID=1506 RepID=UPI0039ECD459